VKTISLTQGKVALVSNKDYEMLSKYKWRVINYRNVCYAFRSIRIGKNVINIRMHREILGLKRGDKKQVDHINHNGLDNRRINLRQCTNAENHHNQRKFLHNCSSMYKGVSWYERDKKWQSLIRFNNKRIFLGKFDSEIEAAKIYDCKAKQLFGQFALTNFL